jgi:PAS domain S-box-containing protein
VEVALRYAEEQYRTIFENAVEGIFQSTPEGYYLKANPMLARIYGYESPEHLMTGLTDIAHQLYLDPNRRAQFMSILQEDDAIWNFESRIYRRDGSIIWISENARAIRTPEGRQRESQIGARIQQTLLFGRPPSNLPGVAVAALTVPSQQIDGDFYDFLAHHDRCFDVVVGDVMGKGVPAALLGAAIKSRLLHALSRLMYAMGQGQLPQPEEIVNEVHADLTEHFMDLQVFATLCYYRFDLATWRASFVDCGHTKTIHYRRREQECVLLQGENMPLGCNAQEVYRQVMIPFAAGDMFLFYSDGVSEARDKTGEFFDVSRIVELVRLHGSLDPQALIEKVRQAVVAHSGFATFADDLTCVAVSFAPLKG